MVCLFQWRNQRSLGLTNVPLSSIKNDKRTASKVSPSIHLLMLHWSIQHSSWTVYGHLLVWMEHCTKTKKLSYRFHCRNIIFIDICHAWLTESSLKGGKKWEVLIWSYYRLLVYNKTAFLYYYNIIVSPAPVLDVNLLKTLIFSIHYLTNQSGFTNSVIEVHKSERIKCLPFLSIECCSESNALWHGTLWALLRLEISSIWRSASCIKQPFPDQAHTWIPASHRLLPYSL